MANTIKLLPYEMRKVKPESIVYDTICNEFHTNFIERVDDVIKYVQRWRILKSSELSTRNVGQRIIFTDNIVDGFFTILGIPKERIVQIIKSSKYIKPSWEVSAKPFHNLLVNMVFFYFNHTPGIPQYDKIPYEKIENNLVHFPHDWCNLFLSYKYFTSLQFRQFKHGADDAVMEYTLANMNKKYDIVKAESLMQILDEKSFTNLLYYQGLKRIIDPTNNKYKIKPSPGDRFKFKIFTDENVVDYANYLWSRLSDFIVNVARVYYANHASGNASQMEMREIENEEGKKSLVQQTSISNDIISITKKIILRMSKDANIDATLLMQAKKLCNNIGYKVMADILDSIRTGERDFVINESKKKDKNKTSKKIGKKALKAIDVNTDFSILENSSPGSALILNIISYYIVSKNKPVRAIHSSNFIMEMINAYSVSNVKDSYILRIKEILNELLMRYKEDIYKTQISNAQNSMRKCVFIYYVLYISKYADI